MQHSSQDHSAATPSPSSILVLFYLDLQVASEFDPEQFVAGVDFILVDLPHDFLGESKEDLGKFTCTSLVSSLFLAEHSMKSMWLSSAKAAASEELTSLLDDMVGTCC